MHNKTKDTLLIRVVVSRTSGPRFQDKERSVLVISHSLSELLSESTRLWLLCHEAHTYCTGFCSGWRRACCMLRAGSNVPIIFRSVPPITADHSAWVCGMCKSSFFVAWRPWCWHLSSDVFVHFPGTRSRVMSLWTRTELTF